MKNVDLAKAAEVSGIPADTIKRIAHDFAGAKSGLALAGGAATTGPQATDALIAVNLLNQAVGAVGRTIRFGADSAIGKASPYSEMVKLTKAMAAGEIEVLILADVNPVYAMPPKAGFAEALGKVPMVVSLATRPTETSARAGLLLPALHPLESWGDYVAREGVVGLMQPTMGPVAIEGKPVEGKPTGDILLSVGRQALGTEEGKGPLKWASFEDYVREQWQGMAREYGGGKNPVDFWEESLRRGGAWRAAAPASGGAAKFDASRLSVEAAKLEGDGTHALIVYPSLRFYDGRSADQPWLQEAPDTMTQVAWGGWVEVPAETASKLDLSRGDVVKLTSPNGSVELPAWPSPTLHPGAVAVAMGLGHDYPGAYARAGNLRTGHLGDVMLNGGANPIRLLGAESRSGLGRAAAPRGEGISDEDRRPPAPGHSAGDLRRRRPRDRGSDRAGRRARDGAPRQIAGRREPPEHVSARSSTRTTAGAWPSTPMPARAARPASSPAPPRTMCRWWARRRSPTAAPSSGYASSAGSTGPRARPPTSSSPCSASTARSRRASPCVPSTPRITPRKGSTRRSTTAAWARATAATTVRTTCAASTGSTTAGPRPSRSS